MYKKGPFCLLCLSLKMLNLLFLQLQIISSCYCKIHVHVQCNCRNFVFADKILATFLTFAIFEVR